MAKSSRLTERASRTVSAAVLGFVCLLSTGCGKPTARVTGRIVMDGKPLPVNEDYRLNVSFCPMTDEGTVAYANILIARVKDDATFSFAKPIPLGKYRVAVQHVNARSQADEFKNRFGEGSSPLQRDVTGDQDWTIDLARPDGN
jgi:hypothetical protein